MSEMHVIDEGSDFDLEMKSLAEAAEQSRQDPVAQPVQPNLAEVLDSIAQQIENLNRAVTGNAAALERIEEVSAVQAGLPQALAILHENIDHKNRISQKQFDTLHEELRTYKDGLLLEILQKPVVRDLIMLFDDLTVLHRRTDGFLNERGADASAASRQVRNFANNLDHIIHSLLEILARMDVQRLEASSGKLDKQRQRVVSVEPASVKEEDQDITTTLKPGFMWRERLLRPEEVVIRKWQESGSAETNSFQK